MSMEPMNSGPLSPKVAGVRLGVKLAAFREAAHLTTQQLAEAIGKSQPFVTRLEGAKRRPEHDDVVDILELLGASPQEIAECVDLARQARKRGWWQAPSAMGARQRTFAELEEGVRIIRQYSLSFPPGLTHTPEYAEIRAAGGENQTLAVKGRLARQQVILKEERPAEYHLLLDESVLRRRSAPWEIQVAQLRRLMELGQRENVQLQVIPYQGRATMNSFILYGFDQDDPTMVIIETLTTDIGPTSEDDIESYERLFDWLAESALDPEGSMTLIGEIADELEKEEHH